MKFFIKAFFSKRDQICSYLQSWSHLPKTSFMENFIFCAESNVDALFFLRTNKIFFNVLIFSRFSASKCYYFALICYETFVPVNGENWYLTLKLGMFYWRMVHWGYKIFWYYSWGVTLYTQMEYPVTSQKIIPCPGHSFEIKCLKEIYIIILFFLFLNVPASKRS